METDRKEIPFGRPMIGQEEHEAVNRALESPQLVHGPKASEFEHAFARMLGEDAFATTVSSCTAGLHLAYLNMGLGPGDEVIVPAQTHVATAHAVEVTGAKPVFVDCDSSGNVDVEAIESRITDRTRAICVVHYLGLPVDVEKVKTLAKSSGLTVVEDCALAIGGRLDGVSCGLLGDVSSFSFYPVKHMTTGEGGMVVSRDPDLIASIASLKAFGYDRPPASRSIPGLYDVARLGINYRMSEMAAAMGLVQLTRLEQFAEQRNANSTALRSALAQGEGFHLLPPGNERMKHANYCLVAVLDDSRAAFRDAIAMKMRSRGIGTSIYYPVPLPLASYYRERYGNQDADYPNASRISYGSIALPIGPHLNEEDMAFIAKTFLAAVQETS